jgi:DNA polymerase-3 subunit gamma/tau
MSYVVLARKWRPQTFDDVVGQEHITTTLKNAIESDRLAHAYLFVGPRGIGKTSTARILAKALACEKGPGPEPCNACTTCAEITAGNNMDVIEIDAASSSRVEDVRELRDNVRFAPVRSRFKMYIIDEVHMLSPAAFNALLKTLEEPPSHTKFVLATTEIQKVPATIISRCQRFDFRRISGSDILDRLKRICADEKIEFEEDALFAVSKSVEGSLRDAESILDQLITFCDSKITYKDVESVLGLVDWRVFHDLCSALRDGKVARELEIVDDIASAGKDLGQFTRDLVSYFRHLLVCRVTGSDKLVSMPADERAKLAALADRFTVSELLALVERSAGVAPGFRGQFGGRVALEAFLMSATKLGTETSVNAILEKLVSLEERLRNGACEAVDERTVEDVEQPPAERPVPSRPAADTPLAEIWAKVVDAVAQESYTASSFLGHARPVGIEDNKFVVEFSSDQGFYVENVHERSARRLIENKLQEVLGKKLVFQAELVSESQPESSAETADNLLDETEVQSEPQPTERPEEVVSSPEDSEQSAAATVQDDEKVKMVLDLFGGEVVQVDKQPKTR